jgi:hypothetical protein
MDVHRRYMTTGCIWRPRERLMVGEIAPYHVSKQKRYGCAQRIARARHYARRGYAGSRRPRLVTAIRHRRAPSPSGPEVSSGARIDSRVVIGCQGRVARLHAAGIHLHVPGCIRPGQIGITQPAPPATASPLALLCLARTSLLLPYPRRPACHCNRRRRESRAPLPPGWCARHQQSRLLLLAHAMPRARSNMSYSQHPSALQN